MHDTTSLHAVVHDRVGFGFFAIDAQRGAEIAFTRPYVPIEGCYLVRAHEPLQANEEVDRAGHVVAGQGPKARSPQRSRGTAWTARSRPRNRPAAESGGIARAPARGARRATRA